MSFPKAVLSRHAELRLQERSALPPSRLLGILNRQAGRKVRCSKLRSHLLHRMYWSPEDLAPFIAVQDVVSGTVLTILTLEMYKERPWSVVTDRQILKVINEAVLAGDAPTEMWAPDKPPPVRVCAGLSDTETVTVGYWNGLAVPDLEVMGTCRQFWGWLARKLGDRGYEVDTLEWVSARLPNSDATYVRFAC